MTLPHNSIIVYLKHICDFWSCVKSLIGRKSLWFCYCYCYLIEALKDDWHISYNTTCCLLFQEAEGESETVRESSPIKQPDKCQHREELGNSPHQPNKSVPTKDDSHISGQLVQAVQAASLRPLIEGGATFYCAKHFGFFWVTEAFLKNSSHENLSGTWTKGLSQTVIRTRPQEVRTVSVLPASHLRNQQTVWQK